MVNYTYDEWGKPLTVTDGSGNAVSAATNHIANINPIRYRGYYYDSETGFYHLQSRYYDPEIGRFLNADGLISTGQGILGNNMFAYCLNDPINRIDSDGQFSLKGLWNGLCSFSNGFVNSVNNTVKGIFKILTTDPITNIKNAISSVKENPTSVLPFYGTFENIVLGICDLVKGETNSGLNKLGSATADIAIAGVSYAAASSIASYASNISMSNVVNSKLFSHNNGYGYKIGSTTNPIYGNVNLLYQNPSFKSTYGVNGGTFISVYRSDGSRIFRIDWDPKDGLHKH